MSDLRIGDVEPLSTVEGGASVSVRERQVPIRRTIVQRVGVAGTVHSPTDERDAIMRR